MTLTWTLNQSADWTNAAAWGGNLPTAADDCIISAGAITVTVSTGSQSARSLSTTASTLALTGGTLSIGSFANLHGNYTQTGGTLALSGNGAHFYAAASLAGGRITSLANSLVSDGGFTLSAGTLELGGNGAQFNGALSQSGGAIVLDSGTLALLGTSNTLGGAISGFGGLFIAGAAGGTTTVQGSAAITVTSLTTSLSTLAVTGGTLSVQQTVQLSGAYVQSGGFTTFNGNTTFYGTGSLSGGTLASRGNQLVSNGGFTQSGGSMVLYGTGAVFNGNLAQQAGQISVASGSLLLQGAANTLSGTISGAGTLVVAGGQAGTTTITGSTVLSVSKLAVSSGVLAIAQTGSPINFTDSHYFSVSGSGTMAVGSGNTLTLAGRGQLGGTMAGGTVQANGGGQLNGLILDNAAVLDIGSAYTLTAANNNAGVVTLKASSQIDIQSAGSLRLTGNDSILDSSNNGLIIDSGKLSRIGGSTSTEIAPSFVETSGGSIAVGAGTLDFSGASVEFGGAVSGAGTFSIGASNTPVAAVFDASLALTSAAFVLTGLNTQLNFSFASPQYTYAGNWDQSGGVFLLGNQGQPLTLNLTGGVLLDGGVIKSSAGTIATTGLVELGNNASYNAGVAIEGFTHFNIGATSTVTQSHSIQLGGSSSSKPVATIAAGASWNLEDAASINGAYGTLDNLGTLAKVSGGGASSIQSALVSTGTIAIASSELILSGQGTLGGTISGTGTLALEGSGTYFLQSGLQLKVASVLVDNPLSSVVALTAALSYGGNWAQHGGTVQLNNQTLTLSGPAALDGGTLSGIGQINLGGNSTIGSSPDSGLNINAGAVLNITKSSLETGNVAMSGGTLSIAKGGSLVALDNANITGAGQLVVAGNLGFNGTGLSTVAANVTLTGVITVNSGELSIGGAMTGSNGATVTAGSIAIHSGARLDLGSAVGVPLGSVEPTINMSAGHASLLLTDASAFAGIVSGFTAGDFIEISGLNSGFIQEQLDATGKVLTLTDNQNHVFTLDFAQVQTLSNLMVATGPHGYLGVYHL